MSPGLPVTSDVPAAASYAGRTARRAELDARTDASVIRPAATASGADGYRDRARGEDEQVVNVTIGRIRVDAPAPSSAPKRPAFVRPKPSTTLAEYTRRRGGEP